jgi:hypothetical protein
MIGVNIGLEGVFNANSPCVSNKTNFSVRNIPNISNVSATNNAPLSEHIANLPQTPPDGSDIGQYSECNINFHPLLGLNFANRDPCNGEAIFPEWVPVKAKGFDFENKSVILEGTVVEGNYPGVLLKNKFYDMEPPQVSFKDIPISDYTHDMSFHVMPDSPEYTNILGLRHDKCPPPNPDNKMCIDQDPAIEVEWELGLAAGNDYL